MAKKQRVKKLESISFGREDTEDEGKIFVNVINEQSKTERIQISRSIASRIESQKLIRDHTNYHILFFDDDGVVHDLDKEPKNSNLPIEEDHSEQQQTAQKFVILQRNKSDEVTIKSNRGMAADTAAAIRDAVQDRIKDEKELKAYDIIEDAYFVFDIREDGRHIYVELN